MWYFLILFILCIQVICSAACKSDQIIERISTGFFGGTSDICYISDDFSTHEALRIIKNNRYILKMDGTASFMKIPYCLSMIISLISSNETTLYQFIERNIKVTNSKVLIIIYNSITIEKQYLFNITWERNLNIIILEGLPDPFGIMGADLPEKHEKYPENITLYSVMWNELDLTCFFNDFNCFSNISFSNRSWKPESMFEKLKRGFKVSASAHPPYFERHGSTFRGVDCELVKLMVPEWPINFRVFPEKHESGHGVHYESLVDFLNNANDGDMSVGGLWLTNDFPSTHPYVEQCNTFLVHRPSLLPDSTFVFQYFQAPLWISYLCVLILMSFVLKFSYNFYNIYYSFDHCLVLILHYVANLGIVKFPERGQFYARYVLTVWMVFCLLMTTYFSVGLTVTLRFPRFTQAINYWHDMVDIEMKWVENSKFYKDLLANLGIHDEYLRNLANLFQYEEDIVKMNEKLAENHAVRVQRLPGFYLTNTGWMDEYARKNFKLLKDCVFVWYNSFLFRHSTPFLEYFNMKTLEMVEYGFVKYWYQHITYSRKNRYMMLFFNEYSDEVIQLIRLDKLKSGFFLLSCGLCLSGFVFLLEKLRYSFTNGRATHTVISSVG